MSSSPVGARAEFCRLDRLRGILGTLRGRRVTLMGLGLFHGGEGAARFLVSRGAALTVTDLKPAVKLAGPLQRLRGLPINFALGGHSEADFVEVDLVVANPAVLRTSAFLAAAQRAGVPVASPMNIFLALCPAPVAAVTGSNGKSTTTAMLAAMLHSAGRRAWLGGNIGVSLLPSLSFIDASDLVVLELSSFQLEDTAALRWSPHVAVVTNVTPNHLDRHGSFPVYAAAKREILAYQSDQDYAVLNSCDMTLRRWGANGLKARLRQFSRVPVCRPDYAGVSLSDGLFVWQDEGGQEALCSRDDVPLPGLHNAENAMAAAAAARCLGAEGAAIRNALRRFVGLEHRLELVGELEGISFYDDSFSTTPESTIAALKSFCGPVTLVAGGYDKKSDLAPLARCAAESVEALVTMGQTGPFLAQKTRQEGVFLGRSIAIKEARDLPEAIGAATGLSMPGSAVLFSPGCASYDMFDNCSHRGKEFKRLVMERLETRRCRRKGA